MVITVKMLEELREALAGQSLVIEDDEELKAESFKIMRFVLCKERRNIELNNERNEQNRDE